MRFLSMFIDCMIRGGTGADPGTGVRPDIGVVILRCKNCTCGGAWVGWMQALAWFGEWCGLVCQFRIVDSVQFPPVMRIKSPRTPHKSGLWPEVYGWWELAQSST